jgi:hypothetical protein
MAYQYDDTPSTSRIVIFQIGLLGREARRLRPGEPPKIRPHFSSDRPLMNLCSGSLQSDSLYCSQTS